MELKPCPFCGSKNVGFRQWDSDNIGTWIVICWDCENETSFYDTQTEAAEKWNTRHDTQLQKAVELLEEATSNITVLNNTRPQQVFEMLKILSELLELQDKIKQFLESQKGGE